MRTSPDLKVKNMFPRILKYALKALDNENRQRIITLFEYKGRPLRYNEIAKNLEISSSLLDHHLKMLEKGNIVSRKIVDEKDGMLIYYEVTPFGKRLLNNLLVALTSNVPIVEVLEENQQYKTHTAEIPVYTKSVPPLQTTYSRDTGRWI